ncbi:MAG: N-acetylmuramoyl-L-alanine amidase [Bacteroidetes bacterium]|nr:N-acetylmuramoyl-L-alanine amidase [Bacteroidota bacterium]
MTCRSFLFQKTIHVILCLVCVLAYNAVSAQTHKKHHHTTKSAKKSPSAPAFKFRTVIIDAGHGGKDPGAHGAYSKEKNITLAIAKKLRTALTEQIPSLNVVMTRTTDNFVELHRRDEIASENKGNLFISIHCNSSPERVSSERGVLLLVYGFHRNGEQLEAIRENASIYIEKDYQAKYNGYGENSAVNAIVLRAFQQKFRKQCILFADLVNKEFKKEDGRHSLGVKEQGVLVLQQSAMPAVLIETGFINNPKDEAYLNSSEGQLEIVQSIIRAIKKYKAGLEEK